MLDRYIDSLERARNADEIDEKQFLFMRAHAAVNDALMNVTKGDYARFNDQTYREVYDEIEAIANKKYEDEALAHEETKNRLNQVETDNTKLSDELANLRTRLDAREEGDFNRKCSIYSWVIFLISVGFPYLLAITFIELTKGKYDDLSISSIIHVGLLLLVTVIAGLVLLKVKKWCFATVRTYLKKRSR